MRNTTRFVTIILGTAVVVSAGCGAAAERCGSNNDCAFALCVDGSCRERFIGETTDAPPTRGPRGRASFDFDDASRIFARPLYTSVEPSPPPPLPDEPLPTPPPLNDDDDEDDLPASCFDYLVQNEGAASGFYRVSGRSEAVVVECDMETDGGGWTIVADIARDGCPSGWSQTSAGYCDRPGIEQIANAHFPLHVSYSEVRGSARAWSTGENKAFDVGILYEGAQSDSLYVDGLALSVNNNGFRDHLWTFAAGGTDPYEPTACPSQPNGTKPPSDIEAAYSCDAPRLLSLDLWDGEYDQDGDEDVGDFTRSGAPQGDEIEARIMSPLLGLQSRVWITSLAIAVR